MSGGSKSIALNVTIGGIYHDGKYLLPTGSSARIPGHKVQNLRREEAMVNMPLTEKQLLEVVRDLVTKYSNHTFNVEKDLLCFIDETNMAPANNRTNAARLHVLNRMAFDRVPGKKSNKRVLSLTDESYDSLDIVLVPNHQSLVEEDKENTTAAAATAELKQKNKQQKTGVGPKEASKKSVHVVTESALRQGLQPVTQTEVHFLVGGKLYGGRHLADFGGKANSICQQLDPACSTEDITKSNLVILFKLVYQQQTGRPFDSDSHTLYIMNPVERMNISKTTTDHHLHTCEPLDTAVEFESLLPKIYIVAMPTTLVESDEKIKGGSSVAPDAVWSAVVDLYTCSAEAYIRTHGTFATSSSSSSSEYAVASQHTTGSDYMRTPVMTSLKEFSFVGGSMDQKLDSLRMLLDFASELLPAKSKSNVEQCQKALIDLLQSFSALSSIDLQNKYRDFPISNVSCGPWKKTSNPFDADPFTDIAAHARSPACASFSSTPVYTVCTVLLNADGTVDEETEVNQVNITELENMCGKCEIQSTEECGGYGAGTWFSLSKVQIKSLTTIISAPKDNYFVVVDVMRGAKRSFPCSKFVDADPPVEG